MKLHRKFVISIIVAIIPIYNLYAYPIQVNTPKYSNSGGVQVSVNAHESLVFDSIELFNNKRLLDTLTREDIDKLNSYLLSTEEKSTNILAVVNNPSINNLLSKVKIGTGLSYSCKTTDEIKWDYIFTGLGSPTETKWTLNSNGIITEYINEYPPNKLNEGLHYIQLEYKDINGVTFTDSIDIIVTNDSVPSKLTILTKPSYIETDTIDWSYTFIGIIDNYQWTITNNDSLSTNIYDNTLPPSTLSVGDYTVSLKVIDTNGKEYIESTNININKKVESIIRAITSGSTHNLLLGLDGSLYVFGANNYGQLGNGTTERSYIPIRLNGIPSNIEGVHAGFSTTFIKMDDGTVYGCGLNEKGNLGIGSVTNQYTPVIISSLGKGVKELYCGYTSMFAVMNDGRLLGWGSNAYGELGIGNTISQLSPTEVGSLKGRITKVDNNGSHTLFLLNDGTVMTTGNNGSYQLGIPSISSSKTPVVVPGLPSNVVDIATGVVSSYALMSDGTVYGWGDNRLGQLGTGDNDSRQVPTKLPIDNVDRLLVGNNHCIAIKSTGDVYVWGSNTKGELGLGDTTNRINPTKLDLDGKTIVDGTCGDAYTILELSDGLVYGSGYNVNGQIGVGNIGDKYVLTPVDMSNIINQLGE